MTIILTQEMQAIVEKKIQAGEFADPGEVVLEGLRLLNERDQAKLTDLRAAIGVSIDEADQGLVAPFEPMKTLERMLQNKRPRVGGK